MPISTLVSRSVVTAFTSASRNANSRTDADEPHVPPADAEVEHLQPLGADQARELLARAAPDLGRDAAASIPDAAEGNPLFLLETARLVDG
jgi:hypothetical protein